MASDALGQQAYRVVEELSVHIGPRPAGSAVDHLEDELRYERSCARLSLHDRRYQSLSSRPR